MTGEVSTVGFECPWQHPACAKEPGPNHFRHVPVAVAAAMPETPDYYLLNAWVDKAAYLALASRSPRSAPVKGRVLEMCRYGPSQFPGEDEVTGSGWLLAALAGDDLTAAEVGTVASYIFQHALDDPATVIDRVLSHPATSPESVAGVIGSMVWTPLRLTHLRTAALAQLDRAGWPASLAWRMVHRDRVRFNDKSAGQESVVFAKLVEHPELVPAIARLVGTWTGTAHELFDIAAEVVAQSA